MSFKVLQECLVKVFTLRIATWYMIILPAMWNTFFRCDADGVTETLISPIHIRCIRWRQSPGKFVCESNVVVPLGLVKVSSLYRLAWCRTSKPGWSNKRGLMLRPWKLFKTCLSGTLLFESILINARSRLALVFQWPKWKLAASYGLWNRTRLLVFAQSTTHFPSALLAS